MSGIMSSKFSSLNVAGIIHKSPQNSANSNDIQPANVTESKLNVYEQQMQAFWYTLAILMFYALLILYFMLKQICRQVSLLYFYTQVHGTSQRDHCEIILLCCGVRLFSFGLGKRTSRTFAYSNGGKFSFVSRKGSEKKYEKAIMRSLN